MTIQLTRVLVGFNDKRIIALFYNDKRIQSFSFVLSNCEFVTFPLVSRVRCGT